MRIGIFDPYLDSVTGGEKYMLKAALCLSSSHSVSIFWDLAQEAVIRQKAKDKFNYDLGNITFVPNIFAKSTSLLSRYLTTRSYDKIFYLSDGSIPLVASKLFIHFQFPVEWVRAGGVKTKIKMHRVSKVICNSFFTKSFIDRKFFVDSSVLYPPVQIELEDNTEKENIILHVGRFGLDREGVNYKKQDVMIDAFKKMVDEGFPVWKFLMVINVNDSQKNELENLKAKTKGYPIEIIENPPFQRLEELYEKAKIYWHASGFGEDLVVHPEKAEHFGISTVEAMVHKVVPVVINAGGQKEIVESGKSGYLWDSLDELIKNTRELADNPDKLVSFGENASLAAKRFSQERFCTELHTLFEIE